MMTLSVKILVIVAIIAGITYVVRTIASVTLGIFAAKKIAEVVKNIDGINLKVD